MVCGVCIFMRDNKGEVLATMTKLVNQLLLSLAIELLVIYKAINFCVEISFNDGLIKSDS